AGRGQVTRQQREQAESRGRHQEGAQSDGEGRAGSARGHRHGTEAAGETGHVHPAGGINADRGRAAEGRPDCRGSGRGAGAGRERPGQTQSQGEGGGDKIRRREGDSETLRIKEGARGAGGKGGRQSVSEEEDEIAKSSAPLIEHLIELRRRLMWSIGGFVVAFLVCFFFAKELFLLLVIPFQWATQWAGLDADKVDLIYTAPQEFFFTQIKIAAFGGMVLAFPLIAAQIYKFVAPGLYRNERAAFRPFLVASPILFLMGGALVYFFFTPMVMW